MVNGQRGSVWGVGEHELRVDTGGSQLTVGRDYLDDGHLHHGYAVTAHKAQGVTVDRTFVLASDLMYREWAYVALSRGRHHNALHIAAAVVDDVGELVHAFNRTSGQQLAQDAGRPTQAAPPTPRQRQLQQLQSVRDDARRQLDIAAEKACTGHERLSRADSGLRKFIRRAEAQGLRQQAAYADGVQARWEKHLHDLDAQIAQPAHQLALDHRCLQRHAAREQALTADRDAVLTLPPLHTSYERDLRPREPQSWDASL